MRIFGKNTPNNNQSAVRLLAKACRRFSKGRNRILAGASALGIIVLCTVFSIAYGKMEADYLQAARGNGTVAASFLERGTMEQYHAIQELDYVDCVGRQVEAGLLFNGTEYISGLEAVDPTAWEKMQVPAYTHIHGKYPQEEGELMLSVRALEELHISEPKEGMALKLSVKLASGQQEEMDFTLCGWFREYLDPGTSLPAGYTSEAQVQKWGRSLEEPDLLMICQKSTIDGYSIEDRLYQDIPVRDRTQRFLGGNRYSYTVVNDFVGGYGMAVFCAVLVLAGVFFLIYNIFGISMQKEIRQIGLLDILGTTQRQIREIYLRQTVFTICQGTILGAAGASVVILFLVPRILGNLYLYNFGKSADLLVFRPELLIASAGFTAIVVFGAAAGTIYQAARLTPLDALHYRGALEKDSGKKRGSIRKHTRFTRQNPILYMAWQNLIRYKKRCVLTIVSLFLGVVTALGAVVLTTGTDHTYSIEKDADFSITGGDAHTASEQDAEGNVVQVNENDDFSPITEETKNKLLSIQGMQKENAVIVRGAYLYMDRQAEALAPLMETLEDPDETNEIAAGEEETGVPSSWDFATIQIVDEEYIGKLEEYAVKNQLSVDIESLRDGSGAVLLHHHALSQILYEEAEEKTGLPVTFWQLPSKAERTASWEQMTEHDFESWREEHCHMAELKLAGYLDTKAKGFPKLRRTWFGPGIKYFLVSDRGFAKLGTKEKFFVMELNVDPESEPAAKAAVWKILQDENRRDGNLRLSVSCKSDFLASAQEYIRTNRIILGALSLVLILMGLLNYLNVIATGILTRQRELAVMECVGMTGKQMKRMLALEGVIYCVIVGGLVLTVGSGLLQMIRFYMERRIAYFKFIYPGMETGCILAALFAACLSVPLIMYGHLEKRSLTRRTAEE